MNLIQGQKYLIEFTNLLPMAIYVFINEDKNNMNFVHPHFPIESIRIPKSNIKTITEYK